MSVRYSRGWRFGVLLGAALLVVGLGFAPLAQAAIAAPVEQTASGVVVNASVLNVRSGPGVAFPVIARINRGAVFTVIGRNADASWLQILLAGNVQGWVNSRYVQVTSFDVPITQPITTASAVVTASFLNIRSGPSAGFSILGTMSGGDVVTMVSRTPDSRWIEIIARGGIQGWVNSRFLRPNIPFASLPISGQGGGGVPIPQPQPQPPSFTGIVTVPLNVRSGPGVHFGVITQVAPGQSILLLGRNSFGTWLLIQAPNGFTGWVNANYVLSTTPFANLPVRF
jgi:N-acetylmuramoyl-L-alanine amidase